jgi:hypothetical protein
MSDQNSSPAPQRADETPDVDGSLLRAWVNGASRGERRTYFTGYLPRAGRMFRLANVARDLHAEGKVNLFQKRIAEEVYAYIAERRV